MNATATVPPTGLANIAQIRQVLHQLLVETPT